MQVYTRLIIRAEYYKLFIRAVRAEYVYKRLFIRAEYYKLFIRAVRAEYYKLFILAVHSQDIYTSRGSGRVYTSSLMITKCRYVHLLPLIVC